MSRLSLTVGYIDSASTYDVVAALSHPNVADAYEWSIQSAIVVTEALLYTSTFRMTPGPGASGPASGDYAMFMDGLRWRVDIPNVPAPSYQRAAVSTYAWANRWSERIVEALNDLEHDASLHPWLEWSVENAWGDHSRRMNGLFDEAYFRPLARILGQSEDEIRRLHRLSLDQAEVRKFARGKRDGDFPVLARAYLASALIRGRFHDQGARPTMNRIHHPLRRGVLGSLPAKPLRYVQSSAQHWFLLMLLASAYSETRKSHKRLRRYLMNMSDAARQFDGGGISLPSDDPDAAGPVLQADTAQDAAYRAVKKIGFSFHSSRFDDIQNVAVALGLVTGTSFFLVPWEAMIVGSVGAVAGRATRNARVGDRIAGAVLDRPRRIEEMARGIAGRVEPGWVKGY